MAAALLAAAGLALAVVLWSGGHVGARWGGASAADAEPLADQRRPQRIMSTNVCTDLLLLMLVPKERIASITHLAHDAVEVLMPGADVGVAINHGFAEEVVRQQPDLILASRWSTPVMRRLAARVGAPLVEIDSADSFEDIRRVTRQVGTIVGEPARAEALLAEMDRELVDLARSRPVEPVVVAAWNSGHVVPGEGTLTDAIIRAAGAVNIAARAPASRSSGFSLEELLAARPDVIMRGEDRYDGPSLQESANEHPVVRKAFRGRRITYPASLHACGLPQSARAARQLRAALATIPPGGVAW